MWIGPHTLSQGPGFVFCLRVELPVRRILLPGVLLVVPGHAFGHQNQIDISLLVDHLANGAAVAVLLARNHLDLFSEYQVGEQLPRPLAERLFAFGGINSCQADLVLYAVGVEHGQSVSVGDGYHFPDEGLCPEGG